MKIDGTYKNGVNDLNSLNMMLFTNVLHSYHACTNSEGATTTLPTIANPA